MCFLLKLGNKTETHAMESREEMKYYVVINFSVTCVRLKAFRDPTRR